MTISGGGRRANAARHGPVLAIFTTDLREAELFMSAAARLRHRQRQYRPLRRGDRRAFGGEKETGGGREKRIGQLARLYAPRHQHDQLRPATCRSRKDRLQDPG
jgi:hypothetical protein